jgi:hypothetical protein
MLKYTCNIIDAHLKKTDSKKIPLVYPIVVHQGKRPWPYSIRVEDLVDAPRELVESYFLKPFHLIDLSQISDEILKRQAWAGLMAFVQKHVFARDILPHIKEIATLLRQAARSGGKGFVSGILEYVVRCGEFEDVDDFIELVNTGICSEIGDEVMSLATQLIGRGIKQGMEQGVEQGVEQGKVEMMRHIALNLLLEGQDATFTAKMTGLSLEDVFLLKEHINQIDMTHQ